MIVSTHHNTYNNTFTARCPQIQDSQWVCHAVNSVLPHISTTKSKPRFAKKMDEIIHFENFDPQEISMTDIYTALVDLPLVQKDAANLPFLEKIKTKFALFCLSKQTKKDFKILAFIRDTIANFGEKRLESEAFFDSKIEYLLNMFEEYKLGNCYEDAIFAKAILELNGITNAKVIKITNKTKDINHAVCVFNRDGSPLKYKKKNKPLNIIFDNNKTIIIDPWAGKADFVGNMMAYYRGPMHEHFIMPPKDQLYFLDMKIDPLPQSMYENLKLKYPQLIYINHSRKFMQSK